MDIHQWLEQLGLGQYTAAFAALGIQPAEVPHLTEADLSELGVASLLHRRRILQAAAGLAPPSPAPAVPPTPAERVLQRFPFPIAWGYRRVVQPESATHAVDCVFYTYTALLRFTALAFLGQFLSRPGQNPNAAKALRQLQTPGLESWFTVCTTLGRHLFPLLPGAGLAYAPFAAGGPFSAGLAAAVRQLPKLQRDGAQVHERLRTLRNTRAHGTPWDEAECTRQLPGLRALLEAVLGSFAPLGEVQLLRRSPGGLIRLVGGSEPFAAEPIPEPRMEDLFAESETLLLGPDGDLLPLYPLFLAPDRAPDGTADADPPEGYTEPLLSFDGHGKQAVMYLGVRSWTARQDTLARYLDLLRAKDIDPRFTKADLTPWGVADWARETSRGVIENLTGVKYFPEVYQERRAVGAARPPDPDETGETGDAEPDESGRGLDDAVSRWLDRGRESALILAAEAGSGKTSLLCRLAERHLTAARDPGLPGAARPDPESAQDCVLLLLGGGLRGRTSLFERIREGLGFSDDPARGAVARFDELLAAWQAVGEREDLAQGERRILLLIDALNEAEDPKRLLEEVSALAADAAAANTRAGRPWVRLLVSVRAERIETLLGRWGERSDTPFLQHPQHFAQFPDRRGRPVPWLGLRRFTPAEGATAYALAQTGPGRHCPAPWARLAPATRETLRHPLLLALFHTAYAGIDQPPGLTSADAVWDAWVARTFDPAQGGAPLQGFALDLADACLDGGHDAIPPALTAAWRARWQAGLGHDPVRIAAGLDPLERLTEAGCLRRTETGGLDWVSDALAEQVLFLALRRRDPALSEKQLAAWLALPVSRRLDGTLARVGATIWRGGRPLAVRAVLDLADLRGPALLADLLLTVAPNGLPAAVADATAAFAADLGRLVDGCIAEGREGRLERLKDALLWDLDRRLANRWGYLTVREAVARGALRLAEHLTGASRFRAPSADQEPGRDGFGNSWADVGKPRRNPRHQGRRPPPKSRKLLYLRDLSASYLRLGNLEGRRDPAAARAWVEQALPIARRLTALEPENTEYLRDLSVFFSRLGDLDTRQDPVAARAWYEQALAIDRQLTTLAPEDTEYLRDLSLSYNKLGDLDRRRDPAAARAWFEQALAIHRQLTALEPENTLYLHDLSASYDRLGDLDARRDPAAARAWFEQALAIRRQLTALKPENTECLDDLSASYMRLGDLDARSDRAAARAWVEQGLTITRQLTTLAPEDTEYLRDLSLFYVALGDLDARSDPAAARAWFEQALAINRQLTALAPENTEYLRDLSLSYVWLGGLDARDDPAAARAWFEQAQAIARQLTALDPKNTQYLSDLSLSYSRLGNLDTGQDPVAARACYEQALAIDRQLTALEPEDTEYLRGLSLCYNKLGDLDKRRDPATARVLYEQGLAITRRLTTLAPEDTEYLHDLWLSYIRLGELDGWRDPAAERAWYEQGLAIARQLTALEPENSLYLSGLWLSHVRLGEFDARHDDPAAAWAWYEQALAISRQLTALEPENSMFLSSLSECYGRLGDLDARRDPAAARTWYEQGLAITRQLTALEPENTQYLRDFSVFYRRLGDLDGRNDPAAARARYEQGLAIDRQLAALEPENTKYLKKLATSYNKLSEWFLAQGDTETSVVYATQASEPIERAAALSPEDAGIQYDLACARARLGRTDDALAALARAADLGWSKADWAAEDPDLRPLRGLPAFAAILARMRDGGT